MEKDLFFYLLLIAAFIVTAMIGEFVFYFKNRRVTRGALDDEEKMEEEIFMEE